MSAARVVLIDHFDTSPYQLKSFGIVNRKCRDLQEFLAAAQPFVSAEMLTVLNDEYHVKMIVCLICVYEKDINGELKEEKRYFWSEQLTLMKTNDFNTYRTYEHNVRDYLIEKVRGYENGLHGWTLERIVELVVKFSEPEKPDARVILEFKETAFRNRIRKFTIKNIDHINIKTFLEDVYTIFEIEIKKVVEEQHIIKVRACLKCLYKKPRASKSNGAPDESEYETSPVYIQCEYAICGTDTIQPTELPSWFNTSIVNQLLARIENFEMRGSGWTLSQIIELDVDCAQYDILRVQGSAYMPLPKHLKNKKVIINVQNEHDERCFMWAVLSALHTPTRNCQRPQKYLRHVQSYNWDGIRFPTPLTDIKKFEIKNPTISINVYMYEEKDNSKRVYAVRLTKKEKATHINLLLLSEIRPCALPMINFSSQRLKRTHFCWIKNFNGLMRTQRSNSHATKVFCNRCLQHFNNSADLDQHKPICMDHNNCKLKMPVKDANEKHLIRFKNYENKLSIPYIFYADVEALLVPPTEDFSRSESTIAYQEHIVYTIGYYLHCTFDPSQSYYKSRRGPDCVQWFVRELYQKAKELAPILRREIPFDRDSNPQDVESFENEQLCHICEKELNDDKVLDHCHLTGEYRGAAHNRCNLTYESSKTIPVVFHNLSGYDSHFIIRELCKTDEYHGEVSVIPINDQNYISFTKTVTVASSERFMYKKNIKLKFIDSFRFMASSLDSLVNNLTDEQKKITNHEFRHLENDELVLLKRKGVFPYDFLDSWEKLDERTLPSQEAFYSKLTDSAISDRDYEHAQNVWQRLGIQTLGDYSDLYLKTDILLLADVFTNFREKCLEIYKLDPAHYYTAPGYSWDAMLRHTRVEIELLTDINMLHFVEDGIRGGISQCSTRYAKANNKYMAR